MTKTGNAELSLTEEGLGKLRQDLKRVIVNRVKTQDTIDQLELQLIQLEGQLKKLDTQKIAMGGAIQFGETVRGKIKKSQELAKKAEKEDGAPEEAEAVEPAEPTNGGDDDEEN